MGTYINIEKGASYDRDGTNLRSNISSKVPSNATIINIKDPGNKGTLLNLSKLFEYRYNLVTANVSDLKTNGVLDTSMMFNQCRNLNTVTSFNVSNVLDARDMFNNCRNLNNIGTLNFTNLTNMCNMFAYAGYNKYCSLPSVYISGKITNTYHAFYCSNVNYVWRINFLQDVNVNNMFYKCNWIYAPGESMTISNITNGSYMFYKAGGIYTKNIFLPNVENGSHMFQDVNRIANGSEYLNVFANNLVDGSYMFDMTNKNSDNSAYIRYFNMFTTGNLVNAAYMFCNFNKSPYSFTGGHSFGGLNTINVTNMSHMFCGMHQLPLPNIDTSNCKDMSYFAAWGGNLINGTLNLNTINVTNMYYAFYFMTNLRTIANIDTSNVKDMRYAFGGFYRNFYS